MKKLILGLMTFLFLMNPVSAKEPVIQIVHGDVTLVDAAQNRVTIGAASKGDSIEVYQLQINRETRLVGLQQVSNLKIGQKAEADYFQDHSGQFVATRFELIKPKETEPPPVKKKKSNDPEDFHF